MNSSHTHFIKESFATAKAKSSYSKYIWLLILLIVSFLFCHGHPLVSIFVVAGVCSEHVQ